MVVEDAVKSYVPVLVLDFLESFLVSANERLRCENNFHGVRKFPSVKDQISIVPY